MLILRPTKTGVRFEFVDDDSETTVVLDKTDDDETMIRKLKKVLALAAPGADWTMRYSPSEMASPGPAPTAVGLTTASAGEMTNGWKKYAAAPKMPDRLEGEIEIIEGGSE